MHRVLAASSALLLVAAAAPAAAQYHGPAPHVGGGVHGGAGVGFRSGGFRGGVGIGAHSRWGGQVGGHWYAGMNAPGGWNSYRPLRRGARLDPYWFSSRYYIPDWQVYGLDVPPAGYNWSRYYDDAVLVDGNGYVYNTVPGMQWSRYQTDLPAYDDGYDYAPPPPVTYAPPPPAYAPPPPVGYAPGYADGYGTQVYGVPGGTTVVSVTPSTTTTTTTTTTTEYVDEVTRIPARRHYYRPVRRPACGCYR